MNEEIGMADEPSELIPGMGGLDIEQEEEEKETLLTKKVIFTREPGGKWIVEFVGPIARRDVNRLRIALLIQFSRLKRQARLQNRKALRASQVKEVSDGE
jgi:hypothetical protein